MEGLDVYMHTNRPWRAPDSEIAAASDVYRAHAGAGWWSRNLSHLASRWDCCLRAPMNLPACFKYDWLLERSAEKRRKFADDWIGLLADSDVLYQCSARELRQRFAAFNSPLVVSGERRWFPLPNDARVWGVPRSHRLTARVSTCVPVECTAMHLPELFACPG